MQRAEIKDNIVLCPIDGLHNYQIADYKSVEIKGETYTKFIARCIYGEKFCFFSRITIDKEEHFIFNEDEEIEIKGEQE